MFRPANVYTDEKTHKLIFQNQEKNKAKIKLLKKLIH